MAVFSANMVEVYVRIVCRFSYGLTSEHMTMFAHTNGFAPYYMQYKLPLQPA